MKLLTEHAPVKKKLTYLTETNTYKATSISTIHIPRSKLPNYIPCITVARTWRYLACYLALCTASVVDSSSLTVAEPNSNSA